MNECSTDHRTRRWPEWLALLLIVLLGLLLRVLYLQEISHQPTFEHPLYDPQYNDYWARALVTGDWTPPEGVNDPQIRTTPHGRPPGYPYFLAAIYAVFGVNDWTPRIVQTALGLLNVVLMFLLGRRLFGRAVGLLAAAFMAGYWGFIYFESLLTYPAVTVFLLLCLMGAVCEWHRRPGVRWAFVAGMLLGAFALFRPNGLLFAPVLLFWMGWVLWRRAALRRLLPLGAALALGVALPLVPGTVRNYVVARDFVFVSSYGGLNLYVGNHAGASGVEPRIPELKELAGIDNWSCFDYPAIVRGLAAKLDRPGLKFSEASAWFYRKAFDFILGHPVDFLRLTGKKALLFWGPREITNDTVMEYDKRFSPVLRPLPGFAWILTLFVPGLVLWMFDARRKLDELPGPKGTHRRARTRALPLVLLLFVFSYFLSVIPFFIAGRYRLPIIPFLLLFSAYGAVGLVRALAARDRKTAALWLVSAAVAGVFAQWNPTGYEASEAVWHFRQGLAWSEQGDVDHAIAEYQAAAALDPANSATRINLGRMLARQGRTDEALREYGEALRLNPEDAVLHNNLGSELSRMGREDEAITRYETALRINPDLTIAHTNLGNVLLRRGETDRALPHFQRVADLEPANAAAFYNLGDALFTAGRANESVSAFRRAIELRPGDAPAHNYLGWVQERLGHPEAAMEEYQRALDAQPDYLLALNNLGNALLAQGKAAEAAEQFNKAITARPDDSAAWYNLGNVRAQQGDLKEAEACYGKAVELSPDFADAQNNLGYVLAAQGRFDEAVPHYESALRASPDHLRTLLNLGDAHKALGHTEEMEKCYRRARELAPDDPGVLERSPG
jgi:tetratricopeptide (TPR) repeat protein